MLITFNEQQAAACFNFGFNIPGISSVAVGTTTAAKVKGNIAMATRQMPEGFWEAMVNKGLLGSNVIFKK